MAIYRSVGQLFWKHPAFRAMTPGEKLLALYLKVGPQTNRIGYYYLSIARAAEDLGTTPKTFTKRFESVLSTLGWAFDPDSSVLLITDWWDDPGNKPLNPNHLKGNLSAVEEVPNSSLLGTFLEGIGNLCQRLGGGFAEVGETLPQTYAETGTGTRTGTGDLRLLAKG